MNRERDRLDGRRGPAAAWRDAAVGGLLALPAAVILSQLSESSYRTGAAAMAFLVVLGLALRWTIAAGAAPVLMIGMWAQTVDGWSLPAGRDAAGLVVVGVSATVVVLALRRWEEDRRRAREAVVARERNERRLEALVELARYLAGVADRTGLRTAVEHEIPRAAGCRGAILVAAGGDRVDFAAVAGHDTAGLPTLMPTALRASGRAADARRVAEPTFCATPVEFVATYPELADYQARSGYESWAAFPIPTVGALVLSWDEEQVFSPAQRAFLATIGNLLTASAERVQVVERGELERLVGAFDAMLDGVGIHRAVRDASGGVVDFEVEYLNTSWGNLGAPTSTVIGRRMRDVWPGSPLFDHSVDVLETGAPFILEEADIALFGHESDAPAAVSIRVTRLDADRIVLVVRDVSERVRLLRALQESNEEFAAAQQFAHVGSWRYDVVHDELEWSAELYRITGVPEGSRPARPTGGSLFGFEHPADRGRIVAAIRRAVETREPFTFDMRIIRQDNGEVREVTTTGTLLYDDAGALVRIWGATQDVTQRRRAERARVAALTELERQRAAVSELQQVILPVQLPQPAGARIAANYRAASSAEAVGGDWYDAFEAPDGRVILTVGDVAGHGVKCAALANQLRVSVRIRVQDGMEPGAILALLDSELIGDFATCWLAAFEPETRRLRVASAGHLPALLCRRDSGTLVAAHTRPPLGTHVPDRLDEHILELVPGDLLVACTDGLIERRGEHLDRGFERLMDVAPTARTNDDPALALVEALAVETVDDVCVLTLQVW